MLPNDRIRFNKFEIEKYLEYFARLLSKNFKNKSIHFELIIVGGASVLLNYKFRQTTDDIDCYDPYNLALMNEIVNKVATKFSLTYDWINTDFMKTKSFSNKIEQYSSFYKSFGFGTLNVRTIKGQYLLAMKIVSARKYKNDYSDICGIINDFKTNNKEITIEMLDKAIIDLYGSKDVVDLKAYEFAVSLINKNNLGDYQAILNKESKNKEVFVKVKNDTNLCKEDVDYILSKMEILDK